MSAAKNRRTGNAAVLAPEQARPAPVVLVTGPERYLADLAIRTLENQARRDEPRMERTDVSAGAYEPGALSTLTSPSLFDEPSIVVVDGVESATEPLVADLRRYFRAVSDTVVLVLRHPGGPAGRSLLDEARAVRGAVEVACQPLKRDQEKVDFVRARFHALGRRIEVTAAQALVAAVGNDLGELAGACAQLAADTAPDDTVEGTVSTGRPTAPTPPGAVADRRPAGPAADVTTHVSSAGVHQARVVQLRDVQTYYGGRVEVSGFGVADAAAAGQTARALSLLRHALATGVPEPVIVAALAGKLRTLARVAHAGRGRSEDLARQLGLAPWQIDKARRELSGWSADPLARAIQQVAAADTAVKGGGSDPGYAIERAVMAMAGGRSR